MKFRNVFKFLLLSIIIDTLKILISSNSISNFFIIFDFYYNITIFNFNISSKKIKLPPSISHKIVVASISDGKREEIIFVLHY